jgi:hypothetical protein
LTLAGLSAEKADKIAKTFNSELDSVIEKRR